MEVVVRVSGNPLFARCVLHNILDLMCCDGSDALVCVSKVGANFLWLAPRPSLELAAETPGNIAVARCSAVLTQSRISLCHRLAHPHPAVVRRADESGLTVRISHARLSGLLSPDGETPAGQLVVVDAHVVVAALLVRRALLAGASAQSRVLSLKQLLHHAGLSVLGSSVKVFADLSEPAPVASCVAEITNQGRVPPVEEATPGTHLTHNQTQGQHH